MLSRVVTLALACGVVATGCAAPVGPPTVGDCSSRVRANGVVYTSYGSTYRAAERHSSAQRASCADTGEDEPGSVFPTPPARVATWRLPGYPPEQVLGVHRTDADSLEVFVADSVAPQERERIYRELGGSARR